MGFGGLIQRVSKRSGKKIGHAESDGGSAEYGACGVPPNWLRAATRETYPDASTKR